MARTNVVTQQVIRAGLLPLYTAPIIDGDIVDVGAVCLHVKNAGGAPVTVTVQTPPKVDGLDVSELAVAVPNGSERMIGPFPGRTFARPVGQVDAGRAYVDYSSITGITRAVVKVA